jgi:signal transduction histidine kinase
MSEKTEQMSAEVQQLKFLLEKEQANKQMLSFLTHTLNNSLGTAPEMLRQTIRLLSGEYEKNRTHDKAINNILSLFTTFSIIENLVQTFKQYINEPKAFQLSWQQDNQGEGSFDLVMAEALRQTLSRIFFQLYRKLKVFLPPNTEFSPYLKQLQHSFIAEIMVLELNSQNAEQMFGWIKQHFDVFVFDFEAAAKQIHFDVNKTRFTFLFSIFSEIIFNALKYSNAQSPIQLVWGADSDNYYFICRNSFNPKLRYREQGSKKGLIFIEKLVTMLKDSHITSSEEKNIFTIKLTFSKIHFEETADENNLD